MIVPVVAIVGRSNSGKTGVVEKLIREFKARGYRVGAVKHTHKAIETDVEGKDSWRFTRAGSIACALNSSTGLTVFRRPKEELTIEDALAVLGEDFDIVLVEGFKNSSLPKIEVFRSDLGGEMVCTPDELLAVISGQEVSLELPRFEPSDISGIADFIEDKIIAAAGQDLSVCVNGRPVPLNPFVRDIIKNSILAMLGTLKDIGNMENVSINIRNKAQHKGNKKTDGY